MGNRDNHTEKKAVPSLASGANHVGRNQGFTVPRLKGVECAKGDCAAVEHE